MSQGPRAHIFKAVVMRDEVTSSRRWPLTGASPGTQEASGTVGTHRTTDVPSLAGRWQGPGVGCRNTSKSEVRAGQVREFSRLVVRRVVPGSPVWSEKIRQPG